MSWRAEANRVLATLFVLGEPAPTKQGLFDAYPFGERRYFPYKVWLEQIRAFRCAWTKGLSAPESRRRIAKPRAERDTGDASTGSLFDPTDSPSQ